MGTFFRHKTHPYPPSFSDRGKLRSGKKSDLLSILIQRTENEPPTSFDVKVLDGAAIVHLLPITNTVTFKEYACDVFIPHIKKHLDTASRSQQGRSEVEAYEGRWQA